LSVYLKPVLVLIISIFIFTIIAGFLNEEFTDLVQNRFQTNPGFMKNNFYLSIFLTLYLTLYFLVNFRPDALIIVQNRIKRLRENLFEQLYINRTGQERAKWIMELEQRRIEIHRELKGNLIFSGSTGEKIDSIIDEAWDELLAVMRSGSYVSLDVLLKASSETKTEAVEIKEIEVTKIEEVTEIEEELEELAVIDEAEEIEFNRMKIKLIN
jgi:hypothetical protein